MERDNRYWDASKEPDGTGYFDNPKFWCNRGEFTDEGKANFRLVIRDFIKKAYNGQVDIARGFGGDEEDANNLSGKIARLSGAYEYKKDGWITPDNRAGVAIFFEEIIDLVKKKRSDPKEKNNLSNFLLDIQEKLFSYSPNLSNETDLGEMIHLSVLATRVPEVQGWFGGAMVGEVVYELSFRGDDIVEDLLSQWTDKPVAEVLDFIDFLQSVGAHAIASGDWSFPALDKVNKIIEGLRQRYFSQIAQYSLELASERLENEWDNPTVSVMTHRGNKYDSRLPNNVSSDWAKIADRLLVSVQPTKELTAGDKILPVAKNTIAIFDHSNRALFYGNCDYKKILEQPENDTVEQDKLVNLRNFLRHILDSIYDIDRAELIGHVKDVINFIGVNGLFSSGKPMSQRALSELLANEVAIFDEGEWLDFIKKVEDVNECQSQLDNRISKLESQAVKKNEKLSENTMVEFERVGLSAIADGFHFGNWHRYWEEFVMARTDGNSERAFSAMGNCVLPFTMSHHSQNKIANDSENIFINLDKQMATNLAKELSIWPPALLAVAEKIVNLPDLHIHNFDVAKEESQNEFSRVVGSKRYKKIAREYNGCLEELLGNEKRFFERISDYAKQHLREVPLPPKENVGFKDYENLSHDRTVNPFRKPGLDISLLLEHLHNPILLDRISDDLGVDLRELTLRAQVYLLNFLSDNDPTRFDRVRNILKKNSTVDGVKILHSFFSCANDKTMGDEILSLAEGLPADSANMIFSKYSEIVDASDRAGDYLCEYFGAEKFNPEKVHTAVDNLLHAGQELLAGYAERVEAGEQLNIDKIVAELQKLNVDVRLFLAGFRALSQSGEKIKLSDVKGLDFGSRERLDPSEVGEMEKIININYVDSPLLSGVLSGFEKALINPDNTFYVLKRDGKIISFFRFEDLRDNKGGLTGETKFASFNTVSDYKGGSLGREIMRGAVLERGETKVIVAETDPESRVCQYYVNEAGFVIDGVEQYKSTGQKVFHIRRDMGKVCAVEGQAIDLGKNYERALGEIENYLAQNFVIARYNKDVSTGAYTIVLAREKALGKNVGADNLQATG